MLDAGDVVADRFELEHLAGSGGMGVVYRARDRLTGSPVAVKLLLTARRPDRFLREGRLLAELSHPGIVKYVAHGATGAGVHYLVMEWLDGEDLATRLARKPLSRAESVTLVRRAAEALAAAHARGIVHRDIKPSNLFLPGGEIDRLKLLDFGVARLGQATRAGTATGALLGTPGYMAPEQALGERDVDARADVFSLGCVFFECLTGRPAFAAEHFMGILAKIVLEDAPRVSEIRDDVPPKLDELVARMLSKDPAGRPANAGVLVQKLDAIGALAGEGRGEPSSGFAARITDREQRLVSVVLAGTSEHQGDAALAATADADAATKSLDVLRRAVAPFGARFEGLADGSLVGTLAGQGTAADQAAQAARCAIAIRARLGEVPIVLATGRSIVAGRLPVGEVIDRATLLLDAARLSRAGAIRIDEVTAGLLDARFEIGGDEAGLVLVAEREQVEVARKLLGRPTPCVGRDREVQALSAIFDECAEEPVARAVLVTAPAGAGKSRLRHELVPLARARHPGAEVWIARGDPMSAGSPFAMLAQVLRRAAGVRDNDPLAVQRQKLRARVARHVAREHAGRVTEFLGELVGAPFPESVQLRAARQDPVVMGDQMRRAFEDFLAAECAAQPVLLVLEDLHWGDLPTVRFVDAALRALHDRALMVLALARPEVHELFPRLWGERRTQEIRLEELTRRASERLVREVLGDGADAETVARVVARAAGNAFYLEELIRAVAEGKGDALPETVIAMAQARLDALDPEARRVLRAASVFGDAFWRGGVHALVGGERGMPSFDAWLETLATRELVTKRGETKFRGEAEYTFRHALVREAAYASLTDSDRKLGHKLAAEWLRAAGERDAMTLAEHFARGGEPEQAIGYFLDAAKSALRGNDFAAALARAERGVASGAEGETLGALRLVQAEAHRWVGAFIEAERCGALALEHLRPGTTLWYVAAGELVSAAGLVGNEERLVGLSTALRDDAARGASSGALFIAAARAAVQLLHLGKYALAGALLDTLERAAASEATLDRVGGSAPPAPDPAVRGWVGRARTIMNGKSGNAHEGRKRAAESAADLEAAGDLRTACLQRMNLGYYQNELGLFAEAETTLRAALADAARIGLPHVTAPGRAFLGYALLGLERHEEATQEERSAIELFAAQGDKRMEAASKNHLARCLLARGDGAAAIAEARAAIALCERVPSMRATSYGVLATALLETGDDAAALAAARAGMELLEQLGGIDQGEARLRLAHARALERAGDGAAARAAIAAAKDRLWERAACIDDEEARRGFLERVPENAQTLDLARAWGAIDSGDRPTVV